MKVERVIGIEPNEHQIHRFQGKYTILFYIRWSEPCYTLSIGMLILPAVHIKSRPLGQTSTEELAGFLNLRFTWGLAGNRSVMTRHFMTCILSDAKDQKPEIHQHRVD